MVIIYMWNVIKMIQKNLIIKRKLTYFKTNLMVTIAETTGGRGKNWEGGKNTYTLLYKMDD